MRQNITLESLLRLFCKIKIIVFIIICKIHLIYFNLNLLITSIVNAVNFPAYDNASFNIFVYFTASSSF